MTTVRASLTALVDVLSDAVAPDSVGVQDGGPPPADPVVVRVLALERIGRSRRDGPVLDLELSAAVRCTGPRSLENVESMLEAVETGPGFAVSALGDSMPSDFSVGFRVRVPVTVRLSEPEGPPIREPLHIVPVVGRQLSGVLVGPGGAGLVGARIRSATSGVVAVSDASGRFELLSTPDPMQAFTVEFRGETRQVTVAAGSLPLTIRWD